MKSLDSYQIWNEAFYHLGAKGSPKNEKFSFSKEEFFIRGLIFAKNDARTLSAFSHWVNLFGHTLDVTKMKELLESMIFDMAWLGYYLDLINQDQFKELYAFSRPRDTLEILHNVKSPDTLLLRWGIKSKPLAETPEKYLHLSLKNRVF